MGITIPQVVTEDRASGAQVIDGSLKFDKDKLTYLSRTPSSSGNRNNWTWSGWVKRTKTSHYPNLFTVDGTTGANFFQFLFESNDKLYVRTANNTNNLITTDLFRDFSAWYHVVLAVDTTQATDSNRLKLYVNGSQITEFSTESYPTEDADLNVNTTNAHYIGRAKLTSYSPVLSSGQMSQVYFIDGLTLTPDSFGFTDLLTGTWRPKKYTGSFDVTSSTGASQSTSLSQTGWAVTTPTPETNIWDGNTSTVSNGHAGGTIGTVTFTPALTGVTKVELYTQNYVHYLNGSSVSTPESSTGWHTYHDGSAITLNSVGNAYSNNTQTVDLMAIRINGQIVDSQTWTLTGETTTTNTNSFYLPMDGNSPIGEDKSGRGNNWTPVNFGGSNSLDKATGAKPILNTTAGVVARPGVFGSEVGFRETVSASSGGGNPYIFDTRGTQPTFNFIRGATYIFDYSGASSHPLKFSTTENGTRNGGTEYTDGRVINGDVISFTVPHNAPDTLWYYCTNHSGMGNSISVTTDETKADPYASNCVLAVPLVGGIDDVSADINATTTKKAATNYGSTDSGDVSNFYGSSRKFDGSNDNINYAASADLGFDGDFTIECFCTPGTAGNDSNAIIASKGYYNTGNNWYFKFNDQDGGHMQWYSHIGTGSGESLNVNNLGTTDANRIYHIAVSRESNVMRFYLDGVKIGNATLSRDYSDGANNGLTLARQPSSNSANSAHGWYDGYISDLRIYKGVAKYTGTTTGVQYFIPASTNPDILPDTPSGVSGSSKLAKITEGAVSFDGAGDYLSFATNSDFGLASGDDFTIECYTYAEAYTNSTSYSEIIRQGTSNAGSDGIYFHVESSGIVAFRMSGTSKTTTGKVNIGGWNHISVCRSSGTLYMSINGVVENFGSVTNSSTTGDFRIGADFGGSNVYKGQLSNVRFVKGTALYTSNFTPPTRALTAVTNTKLLCCQSNTLAGTAAVVPGASGINDGTPWSEFVTITEGRTGTNYNDDASNAFDGDTSTVTSLASGNMVSPYSPTTVVFTPPSAITVSTGVRVYMGIDRGQKILVNGTQTNASVSAGWNDVSFTGSLTSLTIGPTILGSSSNIAAIEIDSVILKNLVLPKGNSSATTFNPFNTDINTVRGQETGYATLNPLDSPVSNAGTLSNGNLQLNGISTWSGCRSTIAYPSFGKWYYEAQVNGSAASRGSNSQYSVIGLCKTNVRFSGVTSDMLWLGDNGYGRNFSSTGGDTFDIFGANIDGGKIIGLAVNMDNNTFEYFVDGVSKETGTINVTSGTLLSPFMASYGESQTFLIANFGQNPFKFPPPAGFQPLNDANVRPETVIARPDQYVGVTTYSGNQGTQSITMDNSALSPDFVWIKCRNDAFEHQLFDSVRGALKSLRSDNDSGEATVANSLTSFDSNGFSLGSSQNVNHNKNYVAWTWKAGGNKGVFNKDDVGYANASDVNMSVGALNNSSYTFGRTWSNELTGSPYANGGPSSGGGNLCFDGVLTTFGQTTIAGGTLIWTPSGGLSYSKSVRVRTTGVGNGGENSLYRLNGGTAVNGVESSWITLATGSGTINTITAKFDNTVNRCGWYAIEVDGKILVDDGVTPPNLPSAAANGASVGTKQGFSIIKWTGTGSGASLSHGLSSSPDFVIVKSLDNTREWLVWHSSFITASNVDYLYLDTTGNKGGSGSGGYWNNTEPSSTTFSVGDSAAVNSGGDFIAYLWHDVPGLQKFGKFTGNGSQNFVSLDFRPAIVWVKRSVVNSSPDQSTSNSSWTIMDSTRLSYNGLTPNHLYANLAINEGFRGNGSGTSNADMTLEPVSNGFYLNGPGTETNADTGTYIYCAWAEAPTFNLYGGQSNAR